MTSSKPIPPGCVLGVLGGGQLGRMFIHAAQQMGYQTAVLEPDASSPAGLVSHHHIQTSYNDAQGLARLAELCSAITTEFENVPADALDSLALVCPVVPVGKTVAIAQDRRLEKMLFTRCGAACAPYAVIETAAQLVAVDANLLPGILKTARMGYDGKGQVQVTTPAQLQAAWASLRKVPCVLEKMLPLRMEVSVIVARGNDGVMVHLPVQRNLHRDGILAVTEVFPDSVPLALANQSIAAAQSIAQELGYVGVLCVEFFVLKDGHLIVNEVAPRPHNSGHYSMDACDVSQFELQVRTLAGLPLTPPRQHSPAMMINLLGDLWFKHAASQVEANQAAKAVEPAWDELLMLAGVHLHLYGKTQARSGRKMGHLTITGNSVSQVRTTALAAAKLLGIDLPTA